MNISLAYLPAVTVSRGRLLNRQYTVVLSALNGNLPAADVSHSYLVDMKSAVLVPPLVSILSVFPEFSDA